MRLYAALRLKAAKSEEDVWEDRTAFLKTLRGMIHTEDLGNNFQNSYLPTDKGDVTFAFYTSLKEYPTKPGIHIHWLSVNNGAERGAGRRALQSVCEIADRYQQYLELYPVPLRGGTGFEPDVNQLVRFYQSMGFTKGKKTKRGAVMLRPPRKTSTQVKAYDKTWVKKMEKHVDQKYQGQPKPQSLEDEKIFTLAPGALAQRLKALHPQDFKACMSAISGYMNRAGKTLLSSDRARLDKAKDELRKLFKKDKPNEDHGSKTTHSPQSGKPSKPANERGPIGSKPTGKIV